MDTLTPTDGTLSGPLQNNALPELLQNLHTSGATGTLTLRRNEEEKSIFIKNGQIIFASSNLEADRLGNLLVRLGRLTQEQMEAVLKMRNPCGKRFGAVVVELGFLEPKNLYEGLKLQVREIIFSLFLWESGDYRFIPGSLPDHVIALVLDPIQLISEIIGRLKEAPLPE